MHIYMLIWQWSATLQQFQIEKHTQVYVCITHTHTLECVSLFDIALEWLIIVRPAFLSWAYLEFYGSVEFSKDSAILVIGGKCVFIFAFAHHHMILGLTMVFISAFLCPALQTVISFHLYG